MSERETGPAAQKESGLPDQLRKLITGKTVPEGRHSIWYYFGGLSLFLLLVMIASGVLLSIYYEPSAAPAVTSDGTPIAAARVTRDIEWNGKSYRKGQIIPLPLDTATGDLRPPSPLRGAVEVVPEETTGEPLRPSAAWASVEGRITHDVEFGALIRSVHAHSANLLVATVLIHMISAFLMRAYRRPRALLWTSGAVLLLLILGFAFTGYLLPWNRLAYFATRVGVSLPEDALPLLGSGLASLLRGGDDVTGLTLTRMYSAHAVALPMATLVFVVLHILLLQVFGVASPAGSRRSGGIAVASALGGTALLLLVLAPVLSGGFDPASPLVIIGLTILPVTIAWLLSAIVTPSHDPSAEAPGRVSFYGNFIYRDFLCWLLAFGMVITLAMLSPLERPGEAGLPVDLTKPLATPEGIRPEWYFIPPYQLLRLIPGLPAALLMTAAGIILFAVPWLDRGATRRHPLLTMVAIAMIGAAMALGIAGYIG